MGGAVSKGLACRLLGHGGLEEEKQWCVSKRLLEDADGCELDRGARSAILMPFYQMLGPFAARWLSRGKVTDAHSPAGLHICPWHEEFHLAFVWSSARACHKKRSLVFLH